MQRSLERHVSKQGELERIVDPRGHEIGIGGGRFDLQRARLAPCDPHEGVAILTESRESGVASDEHRVEVEPGA